MIHSRFTIGLISAAAIIAFAHSSLAQTPSGWPIHDMSRPEPPVVRPGDQQLPVTPPADATLLFDGTDLSGWRNAEGGPAGWIVREDYMESVPDSGYVFTADVFGDVQLHLEFATPLQVEGNGQGRGNSGVFLMGLYEVQVLDSWNNRTYVDGQAAAVYGQYPPLVNACRPPGEWQSFDILFRRPRMRTDGTVAEPARLTVIHNGVLVQNHVRVWGPTAWLQHLPYDPHQDRLPISLQDHGNPVRYRNIWIRDLESRDDPAPRPQADRVVNLPVSTLEHYVGRFSVEGSVFGTFRVNDNRLQVDRPTGPTIDLVPRSETEFSLRWTDCSIAFDVDSQGKATGFVMKLGGKDYLGRPSLPDDE